MPTFEEFKDIVKSYFAKFYKELSEKEVEDYINSDEAMELIHIQYKNDVEDFQNKVITEEQFRIGGASAVASCLYMLY